MTRTQKRKRRNQAIEIALLWGVIITLILVAFGSAYLGATL